MSELWMDCGEWNDRMITLRKRLFGLIRAVDEGYHKSYEGALDITISLPGIFDSEDDVAFKIEISCYLLCYGRGETFRGESMEECLDQFEVWIEDKELQLFGETREWIYKKPDFSKHTGNALDYPN